MDKTLQAALGNDATAAAEMWRAIASGAALDEHAAAWMRHVATRVVAEVFDAKFDAANRRADAALKAIGFSGRVDKDKELRAEFAFVEEGIKTRLSRAEMVETLKLFTAELDDMPMEKAVKKIDRLRKK